MSGIFDLLFVPLLWLFQSQPLSLNPDRDTERFVDEFNGKYGESTHPTLITSSYQETVQNAHIQSKFLLVYLHSPLHEESDHFCKHVLCGRELAALFAGPVLLWAGSVWDPEAYGLSSQLRASAFPFLALLVCQSPRMVQIVDKIQGR
jgi:FAS-associated factor 2